MNDLDFNPAKIEAMLSPEEEAREQWRDVLGYGGLYEVSDMGRVRSYWSRGGRSKRGISMKPRLLALRINSTGYAIVRLCPLNRVRREYYVQRLVLEAFDSVAPAEIQAHHKDEVKTNNRLSNLEWLTPSENCEEREESKRERARRSTAA